jgi:hypothetical protein
MVQFLDANGLNDRLELLVKGAAERLVVCNPLLKFGRRVRHLFKQRQVQDLEIRFLCTRSELAPEDVSWLQSQPWMHVTEIPHLHAKCYLSEEMALVGSLSLYQYRRGSTNEMGTLILRRQDPALYRQVADEVERLLALAGQGTTVVQAGATLKMALPQAAARPKESGVPDWRLADRLGIKLNDFYDFLVANGLLAREKHRYTLTRKGVAAGGEQGFSKRYGPYFSWPRELDLRGLATKPSRLSRLTLRLG